MTREYTDRDIAYVRRHYRRQPVAAIAAELRRSVKAIRVLASRLGVARRSGGRAADPAMLARIRRRHSHGWADPEIAAELGISREWVGELRRRLGLPTNANNSRCRARVAAKTREQCRAAGVRNLGQLRALVHRQRAEAAGWPADLRPRAVEILDLLYNHGPKTRRQIADALGMPWKGSRDSLVSNDPEGSYLAHLIARGLVVCLPRALPMPGRGKNVSIYMIPPYVRKALPRKERQCERTTAERSKPSTRPSSPTSSGA